MPSLEIRDLSVRYQSSTGIVEALSNVNLSMGRGDFTVAIGASGCGKTTLLSVIAGFLAPSRGLGPAGRAGPSRARAPIAASSSSATP